MREYGPGVFPHCTSSSARSFPLSPECPATCTNVTETKRSRAACRSDLHCSICCWLLLAFQWPSASLIAYNESEHVRADLNPGDPRSQVPAVLHSAAHPRAHDQRHPGRSIMFWRRVSHRPAPRPSRVAVTTCGTTCSSSLAQPNCKRKKEAQGMPPNPRTHLLPRRFQTLGTRTSLGAQVASEGR